MARRGGSRLQSPFPQTRQCHGPLFPQLAPSTHFTHDPTCHPLRTCISSSFYPPEVADWWTHAPHAVSRAGHGRCKSLEPRLEPAGGRTTSNFLVVLLHLKSPEPPPQSKSSDDPGPSLTSRSSESHKPKGELCAPRLQFSLPPLCPGSRIVFLHRRRTMNPRPHNGRSTA